MDEYKNIEPNFVVEFCDETDSLGWMISSMPHTWDRAEFQNFASAVAYRDERFREENDSYATVNGSHLDYRVREVATGKTWTAQ